MRVYSLKEHFELRNIKSLSGRAGSGRFFKFKNYAGFSDGSGAVWPVLIADNTKVEELIEGCVYSFRVRGLPKTQGLISKYRDNETFLSLSEISFESGSEASEWSLFSVTDPLSLPLFRGTENPLIGSTFLETETSRRLQLLSHRAEALRRARNFFRLRGYVDLDPPQLVVSGGIERYLKTFKTEYCDHRGQTWQMELPTSPEFSLKKIVAEGASRVFALTHAFRNEGELSKHHDPEFMMMEWYRAGDDFNSLIAETEEFIREIGSVIQGRETLPADGWPVFTVSELFHTLLKMKLDEFREVESFRRAAMTKCKSIVCTDTWDDVFCKLFMEFVEPFLSERRACFVKEYPEQMGALAAKATARQGYVDRFEAYIFGVEICNGYRELLDSQDFLVRRDNVVSQRPDVSVDPQFECVMNVGLYPCVGNALGMDRLIALLLGKKSMQDALPWPFASRFGRASIALE
jgi:lysyl-tRNA synthetase class 2